MAFHVIDLFYNVLNKRKNSFKTEILSSAEGIDKEPILASLYICVSLIFLQSKVPQQTNTCSKATVETLEKGVKSV